MVSDQHSLAEIVARSGIDDPRLIEAFHAVPRADFVPSPLRDIAYQDRPVPIPDEQVTTQPSLSAMMIHALDIDSSSRVLEVGTGLGFQTALVAYLAEEVVTIEMWEGLATQARSNLDKHEISNVEVHIGDGSLGVPESAPFDAIVVSAAFPEVPEPLAEQLVEGGRLVQPIGRGGNETVSLFRKIDGQLERIRRITPARFVRLIGEKGFPADDG